MGNKNIIVELLLLVLAATAMVVVVQAKGTTSDDDPCVQTPYPQLCTSLMASSSNLMSSALGATKEGVSAAHQLASSMELISKLDTQVKAAWSDCLELYEDTITQLDRSSSASSSHQDSQTWLSAAMANQQTCENGFDDLNLSSHFHSTPFSSTTNNISQC